MKSFYEYLTTYENEDIYYRNLIDAINEDIYKKEGTGFNSFPTDSSDYDKMLKYLIEIGCTSPILAEYQAAFRQYRQYLKRGEES